MTTTALSGRAATARRRTQVGQLLNQRLQLRLRRLLRQLISVLARALLVSLRIPLTVRGQVPRGPALLVANHLSWLDIVAALATLPCTFVAKREVRDWPVIGALAVALGVVFVDRQRKRDLLRSIPALEQTLRSGDCVLLFPEGTTTAGYGVLPFRSALFEAAVRANAPVVPIAVDGTGDDNEGPLVCWVGDETLLRNLWRLIVARDITCSLHLGPTLTAGTDRKLLAHVARDHVLRLRTASQPCATTVSNRQLKQNLRPMLNSEREIC